MEIICERPYALIGLFALIPALILTVVQYKRIVERLRVLYVKTPQSMMSKRVSNFPVVIVLRFVFRALAWVMMVLAYAGISWGTNLVSVQKNGHAVTFVFDISYSMMADDASGGLTRLESSKKYANLLLSRMHDVPVSVVLAKGDGVVLVPDTEDRAIVETLLESLSPKLMSSTGTSLGKGIMAALNAIPENSINLHRIFLFTDGDETDGMLEKALTECMKKSVSVSIIGFGGEQETSVIAGDGKTKVYTSLKSEKLSSVCKKVMGKSALPLGSDFDLRFVDATEAGSARTLLDFGEKKAGSADSKTESYYEVRPVSRYGLFLGLAILFFVLSFITVELDPDFFKRRMKKISAVSMVFCLFTMSSCTLRTKGAADVLSGTWDWNQQKWANATAKFLQVSEDAKVAGDKELNEYAVFNLGATYLAMNEDDAALKRFKEISDDATKELRYASFYNMGIIFYRKADYESAAEYFKKALTVDSKQRNAKINLELSIRNAESKKTNQNEPVSSTASVSHDQTVDQSIFNRIRENDVNQWKSSENNSDSSGLDY